MCTRVYVGHLSSRATERDVEGFCKGFGKVRDVVLKNGFGFIEFEDSRDAEDACSELNGRDLCGERVIVELSRGKERGPRSGGGRDGGYGGRDSYGGGRGGDRYGGGYGRDGGGYGGGRGNLRYGPPVQTKYRLIVENLSTRCSWQDLKDMMRKEGEATYCDAHKKEKNLALVCFASHSDLKRAMKAYQGKDINGRKIKLIDDTQSGGGRSRSRSRSHSPRSRRRRSPSRSKSPRDSRSRSPASRSKSRSPASRNGRDSRSRSPAAKRSSHSRSGSPASSAASEKSK